MLYARGMSLLSEEDEVTIHVAAEALDVSVDTIRRWAKKGLIKSRRSEQNHRLFRLSEIQRVQNKTGSSQDEAEFKVLKSKKTKHSVIELFSGCGGMALGFENSGLKTELVSEIDKNACATLKANRPKWDVWEGDIFAYNKEGAFDKFKDKVDVVAGGFPCQAFSYAGNRRGFGEARGTLFFEFLEVVKSVRPKIAIGENVKGLLRHDEGRTLKTMTTLLEAAGYRTVYKVVRSQFLDVPQKRERIFIMGIRKDLEMPHLFPQEKDYTVNLRQAFKDIPESVGQQYPEKKAAVMKLIPAGGYWKDLPIELQQEYMGASFYHTGGRTGMARRLSYDEPSLTLTCSPAQKQTERAHPEENRPLNVREYARIQSFPDEWDFSGGVGQQYKQIGNAVPVNLAYHMGKCIAAMLDGNTPDFAEIIPYIDPKEVEEAETEAQLKLKLK